jgi:hypothetical protein
MTATVVDDIIKIDIDEIKKGMQNTYFLERR